MTKTRPWRIGELASTQGLNPKTLRYYEERGLLPRPVRTRSGYRLYGESDRERLVFIGKAKALGLSLADIRDILVLRDAGTQPCGHVVTLLGRKLAAVKAQLEELTAFRQELETLRTRASIGASNTDCICGIIEQGIAIPAPRLVTRKQPARRSPSPLQAQHRRFPDA